jgi:hypothetical protein
MNSLFMYLFIYLCIMSTGRDYVSELRPTMGLLLIPQVMYELGDPLRNDDAGRVKLLPFPPELCGNPTSRVI